MRTLGSKIVIVLLFGSMTFVLFSATLDLRRISTHRKAISKENQYLLTAISRELPLKFCTQLGVASWYSTQIKGKKTASGEKYNPNYLTAASKYFPFGTELNITNLNNGRNITVVVNDRGPYIDNRIIDLSVEAARELGMKKTGLAPVCVQKIDTTPAPDKK